MLLDPRRNHHAALEAKAWALFPYLASFVWCECSARKERERRGPGRSKQMDESAEHRLAGWCGSRLHGRTNLLARSRSCAGGPGLLAHRAANPFGSRKA